MEAGKINEIQKVKHWGRNTVILFNRLILAEGPGLFVLWGGSPDNPVKANKSYFLEMVETFTKEPISAKPFVTGELWELLGQLQSGHHQCVRVIEDCSLVLPPSKIYETPLAVAVPLALSAAANRRGLSVGRNILILCDNIQEFMKYNKRENEQFLRELAASLDNQTVVTFLGASQVTWDASEILSFNRLLYLGWG